MSKLFGINTADLLANTLSRKGANLTDLYPRSLWWLRLQNFMGQREPSALFLAGERHGDHRARALIENVLAQDKNRTLPGLFSTNRWIQVCPANLTPQYTGHPVFLKRERLLVE